MIDELEAKLASKQRDSSCFAVNGNVGLGALAKVTT